MEQPQVLQKGFGQVNQVGFAQEKARKEREEFQKIILNFEQRISDLEKKFYDLENHIPPTLEVEVNGDNNA